MDITLIFEEMPDRLGSTNPGLRRIRLNPEAIFHDYEAGLPHLTGDGTYGLSAQKKIVFERQGVDINELKAFFAAREGAFTYMQFIYWHEVGHIVLGHSGMSDPLSDEQITKEMEANAYAFEKIGF